MKLNRSIVFLWILAAAGVCIPACSSPDDLKEFFSPKTEAAEPQPAAAREVDPLIRDTVGALTLYSGATQLRVRGFGVVVGLGQNGSTEVPSAIREYLIDFMNREYLPTQAAPMRQKFSAAKLIDSADSAEVEITGVIPPGAPRGTMIDLQVSAIPGTSTRSLEGGLLLPCELRLFDTAASGTGMLEGRVVARGGGPVFVNPFSSEQNSNQRTGHVLGGARTIEARTLQLQLLEPSYPVARRIERRLNERFGQSPPVAEAMSQGYLLIHPPKAYIDRPHEFLTVLPYCTMQEDEGFRARRAVELLEMARSMPDKQDQISAAWEGIGAPALATLKSVYSESGTLGYFAARAGLRLGDVEAAAVLGKYARSGADRIAIAAIEELGNRRTPFAAEQLAPLLSTDQPAVRIAAYEALARTGHPVIKREVLASVLDKAQPGVILDVVSTSGSPMVYFKRTRAPRLAIFGDDLPVQTPVLFVLDDDRLTITSNAPGELTLFARGRTSGKLSDKVTVPANVRSLVRGLAEQPTRGEQKRLRGLGLTYSEVVRVLSLLAEQGVIAAKVTPEQISVTDVVGPLPIRERATTDTEAEYQRRRPRTSDPAAEPAEAEASSSTRRTSDPGDSEAAAMPSGEQAPVLQPRPRKSSRPRSLWDD